MKQQTAVQWRKVLVNVIKGGIGMLHAMMKMQYAPKVPAAAVVWVRERYRVRQQNYYNGG